VISIVNGITDPKIIAEHFVSHFSKLVLIILKLALRGLKRNMSK